MLILCRACSRHLKAAECACPFCGSAPKQPLTKPNRARVARSAMLVGAAAATVSVAIASCAPVAAYGGCPNCEPPDGGTDSGADGNG